MQCTLMLPCEGTCIPTPPARSRGLVARRIARIALWAVALVFMFYGARLLMEQRTAGGEFAAAAYVFGGFTTNGAAVTPAHSPAIGRRAR